MTEEQMRVEGEVRKARSIARLRGEGIPTIDHLPWIECDPATIRTPESVARRVTVLGLLAVHAEPEGMPRPVLDKFIDDRGVRGNLTPGEKKFLGIPSPTERDRGPFTWQYECAYVLLWALGYFEKLGAPSRYCTAVEVSAIFAKRTVPQLIEGSRFRTPAEIFDESDLIFRYHWAARQAQLTGRKPPAGLLAPVCHYRHYALSWLTDSSAEWDNVDTST